MMNTRALDEYMNFICLRDEEMNAEKTSQLNMQLK